MHASNVCEAHPPTRQSKGSAATARRQEAGLGQQSELQVNGSQPLSRVRQPEPAPSTNTVSCPGVRRGDMNTKDLRAS